MVLRWKVFVQSIKKVMNILYSGLQVSKCVKMAATENEDKYLIFLTPSLLVDYMFLRQILSNLLSIEIYRDPLATVCTKYE